VIPNILNVRKQGAGHRIPHNYAGYISNIFCGYFLGNPITYNSEDKDYMEKLQEIFDINDEQSHNADLGREVSIYGVGYEYLYFDDDKNIRFEIFDTREIIPVYEDILTSKLLYVIRYYDVEDIITGTKKTKVELYTDKEIIYYDKSELNLIETDRKQHIFGACPVIEYRNNKESIGDFELVIPKIDEYDKLISDSLNDFDLFSDSYVKLVSMEGTTKEDIQEMKENRVILVPENGDADWMVKNPPFEHIEAMKNRCINDLHKLSHTPDLTDANFASNASGVAMKYKIFGTENTTASKERSFKKGLQQRIKLITDMLNVKGNSFNTRDIDITFTRCLPVNESEETDAILKWRGVVSDETIIEKCPFVKDVQKELDRKKNEVSLTPYTIQPPDNTGGEVEDE
jgi:SPP1 family phage portal protein